MTDDPVRAAARDLIHLWQTEAEAALIALDVWPELGEAIDRLGETLASARARLYPGKAIRFADVEPGDIIRFNLADGDLRTALNDTSWTVVQSHPDESRPGLGYWTVAGHSFDRTSFAMEGHGSFEVIWMGST